MPYSIIGIDFGTSTTVVKIKNYHDNMQPSSCESLVVNGYPTIPTLIFEKPDGELFFGHAANREYLDKTEGVLHKNFKMNLISQDPDVQQEAQRLVKEFFKFLYTEFDAQRSLLHIDPIYKTYVSYPAKWTSDTINFMKLCAVEAGFGTPSTVFGETEPTAAIFAAMVNHIDGIVKDRLIIQDQLQNVMMLDMGAGTSDVTIFKFKVDSQNTFHVGYDNQIINYPTADNTYLCGGREIDQLLTDYFSQYARRAIRPEYANTVKTIERVIAQGIKSWKEDSFAHDLNENKEVSMPAFLNNYLEMGLFADSVLEPLNRAKFEQLAASHLEQLYRLIKGAIERAKTVLSDFRGEQDIDLVILTGGHSQWYMMKDYFLGKRISKDLPPLDFKKIIANPSRLMQEARPQETVANGLVYSDLNFDVAHTSANNIWIQINIGNKKLGLYKFVSSTEVLPMDKKGKTFTSEIDENTFTTKEIEISCDVYVGDKIESSIHYRKTHSMEINDFVAIIMGFPFILVGKIVEWLLNGGEKPLMDIFNSTFKINAEPSISMNADGTGLLQLRCYSDMNSDGKTMYIKI